MKIATVLGTRPEIIKMAPIIDEISKRDIDQIVLHTGQHYDKEMSDNFFKDLEIPVPDYNIHVGSGSHGKQTGLMMKGIEEVLVKEKPDIVLVQGDTNAVLSGALVASKLHIAVGHVEAGLRTYNKYSPYPEEMNRQMVDCMTDMFFAPTSLSRDNLLKENIDDSKIYVTGNTAIDAMSTTVDKNYKHPELDWLNGDKMILLTAHRRENLGEPMKNIFRAIKQVLSEVDGIKVIYPIHKNPVVRAAADEIFGDCDRVKLIEPLEVFDFHNFQNLSHIILTDSGGIQEEAPSLGKPVLVLRDTTERPEGIDAGTLKLVGTDPAVIYQETMRLLNDKEEYERMSKASNPYGDGFASKRIADAIIEKFSN